MKFLFLAISLLFVSCDQKTQAPQDTSKRKVDICTSQYYTIKQDENLNICWAFYREDWNNAVAIPLPCEALLKCQKNSH